MGDSPDQSNGKASSNCAVCSAEDTVHKHIQEKVVRALSRLVEGQMKNVDLWTAFEQIPDLAKLVANEIVWELRDPGKGGKQSKFQQAIDELIKAALKDRGKPTLIVELDQACITSNGVSFGDYVSDR